MSLYLSEIVSVAGKPGLHKLIGNRSNGLIVESLDGDKKRFPTSLTQKVSFLSDISMYTYDGDEKLSEILQKLHAVAEGGEALISKKNSASEIQSFFRKVLENFDEDQVYNSDILKLVSWYKILKNLDEVDFDNLVQSEEEEEKGGKKPKKPATDAKKKTAKSTPKAQSKAKGGVKKSGNLKAG